MIVPNPSNTNRPEAGDKSNSKLFCGTCGYYFENKTQLQEHNLSTHGTAKTIHQCQNSKNHIRGSHSNKRHPCHQCAKEFKWVQALKQHIDCAHEGLIFSTKIKHIIPGYYGQSGRCYCN